MPASLQRVPVLRANGFKATMTVIRRYEIGRDGRAHTVLIERTVDGERVRLEGNTLSVVATGEVILPLSDV